MSKKYTITNKLDYTMQPDADGAPSYTFEGSEAMKVSDGSHTMDELYEHRYALWITLCRICELRSICNPWRSKCHDDGLPAFGGGWFVLGMFRENGVAMTYHLPLSMWDQTDFAETLEKAPPFDGHTSADVLERLKNL